jgi:O-antigen/teichoic acid export membrane protein
MTVIPALSTVPATTPQRTRRLVTNVTRLLTGKIATIAAGFLLARELIQVAGIETYGMWAVCAHLVTWTAVLDLGLSLGLQNAVSHRLHQPEEHAPLAGTISAVTLILAGLALLAAGTMGLLAWFFPGSADSLFGPNAAARPDISTGRGFLVLVVIAITIGLPLQIPVRILAGLQEQGRTGMVQGLAALGGALVIRPLAEASSVTIAMTVAILMPVVLPTVYAVIRMVRNGHGWLLTARPDLRRAFIILRAGLLLLVSQIAAVAVFQTDVLLVSAWHGPTASATYEACARLVGIGVMAQGIILAALWPAVAQGWAQHDRTWVVAAYRRALVISLVVLLPACVLAAIFAEPLFHLWTGNQLTFDPWLLTGYTFFTATTLWAGVHATCLNAVGSVRAPALIAAVQALVNVAAALAVVGWGPWAVAWASAGSALMVNTWPLWHQWNQRMKAKA